MRSLLLLNFFYIRVVGVKVVFTYNAEELVTFFTMASQIDCDATDFGVAIGI